MDVLFLWFLWMLLNTCPILCYPVMFSVQGAPDDHRREHSADECPRRGVTEDAR